MRKLSILLFTIVCLSVSAQSNLSLDVINSKWATRNLKVKGGSQPNVMHLVQTFQQAWPTYSGGELIKFSKSTAKYDNTDKVVDLKNGYAAYSEDDPDSENDEILEACVWRRNNGHRLFAINFHRFSSELDVLCFYDFNPQTLTLSPEKSLSKIFTPSFPGYRYRVFLPQKGKDLTVEEFFGALTIKHTYTWDGMKLVRPQASIEHLDFYQSTFSAQYFFADEHPLTQYALIDVDKDDFPELWLKSADDSYQAVFAVKLTHDLLAGQDDRRTLSIYNGGVSSSGRCGAGCMSSIYCFLQESSHKTWLTDQQEVDFEKGDYGPSTYTVEGKEISSNEGEERIHSLGEPIEPKVIWHRLAQ